MFGCSLEKATMARDSGSLVGNAPAPGWCGSGAQSYGKLRFMSVSLSDR